MSVNASKTLSPLVTSCRLLSLLVGSCHLLSANPYQCPQDVKEAAYRGLVRPLLEYGSCVWDLRRDSSTRNRKNSDGLLITITALKLEV